MRIIAGKWRGRTLKAPRGTATRPTADRVRESLFNLLGAAVEGAAVLDLFAGTGALSLESLSRGAERAVLVERDAAACAVVRENAESLGAGGRARLVRADWRAGLRALAAAGERFDLVFLDPPYGEGIASAAAEALARGPLLLPGAVVAVEEASRRGEGFSPPGEWQLLADRRYGDTRVVLLRVPAGEGETTTTEENA